jgi:hypothetical protein
MEGRKNDWFLVLRLTLALLSKDRLASSVPRSCFDSPVVDCLGVTGKVVECSPVAFKVVDGRGEFHTLPLFALVL